MKMNSLNFNNGEEVIQFAQACTCKALKKIGTPRMLEVAFFRDTTRKQDFEDCYGAFYSAMYETIGTGETDEQEIIHNGYKALYRCLYQQGYGKSNSKTANTIYIEEITEQGLDIINVTGNINALITKYQPLPITNNTPYNTELVSCFIFELFAELTVKQKQVFKLMIKGYSPTQIGNMLNLARSTICTHQRTIREKANAIINYNNPKDYFKAI